MLPPAMDAVLKIWHDKGGRRLRRRGGVRRIWKCCLDPPHLLPNVLLRSPGTHRDGPGTSFMQSQMLGNYGNQGSRSLATTHSLRFIRKVAG